MEKFLNEKFKALVGGGFLGIIAGIRVFWNGEPIYGNIVIFFILKVIGTGLLALTSALFTALGTHLFKSKIKPFFSKNKKKDEE